MNYVNINGRIQASDKAMLPVDNGAFRYGFGLFETLLVQNGTIRLQEYHMDRLFAGMQQLSFDVPSLMKPGVIAEQVLKTVKKNNLEHLCRVRLQVYAGGGGMFGQDAAKPGYIIECFELNEEAILFNENGLTLGIAEGLNKSADSLANLKSCNALIYAMAARQAKANKWNDALVCNTAGNIIESTIANIFWIKEGIIYTPPLSEGCIEGVMRRHVMASVTVKEQALNIDTLMHADEVFLTNAIRKIRWIGSVGNKQYFNTFTKSLTNKLF
ncbi:aminotransferase class IV [Flavipsychrobacter stenotrophus]|uniref:aminotransferase class IV n=1 Tax=Flavipsychrobacter stenotrophus TaxID=2077091 RepID=UPI001057493A|nr:aminotransferase class IV [Flavipsychrobacter stenotrophus]